ncbi:hypothetical protein CDCA_CDCA03G0850 [Cyanidium caldarium]|uniref:Uncharacterized protein n=1 Tax=Cyanidium caldarium TaxID=2771 RepID=A0AAV9IRV0_CYACA|nr:hypothetical protein CDCA_CDCA03G0850 [Cyanidium caldarium]|eukprot:ctg_3243.g417
MSSTRDIPETTDAEQLPLERKIELALPCKERGDQCVRKHRYADAKRAYDDAFVFMFCGRDEFELLYTREQRRRHRQHLLPLHLNRGLCKWKLGDHEAALWDLDEAQRLAVWLAGEEDHSPGSELRRLGHPKALYRRARIRMERVQAALRKDRRETYWDDEQALETLRACHTDLTQARMLAPHDAAIPDALNELELLQAQVAEARRQARRASRALFARMRFGDTAPTKVSIEKKNAGKDVSETDPDGTLPPVPPLERVRLW